MATLLPRSMRIVITPLGHWLGMLGLAAALALPAVALAADAPGRPNIVFIVADDMGFADMGAFGSEINTPNLDSLAKDGVRFTNFYTHASCSPTRSILLSGVDTHLNGLGNMDEWTAPNQRGVPGYEGYLNKRVTLVHIRSGADEPADAYAAVPYKGHWYWIDETDVDSKRCFTFLMILFSLAETGQAPAAPVVTVPSR